MGQHHHHVSTNRILGRDDLLKQFGYCEVQNKLTRDIVGKYHLDLLSEMAAIAEHQWRSQDTRGLVNGFFLFGPPGTGKTTLARRLTLELADRFKAEDGLQSVVMATIDGAEIARSRYGESEERILDIFAHARAGFTAQNQRSVVLFDDIESVFMSRDNRNAKEWHFSQDSVFFHAVDELDTSRCILILTSNLPDLVDEAIHDRFLAYEIGSLDAAGMRAVVSSIARSQSLDKDQVAAIELAAAQAYASGEIRSIRDAEKFILSKYVMSILGGASHARRFRRASM
jgi:SpoVK/Ycf46/Vps4 family AAA+-type ATPase